MSSKSRKRRRKRRRGSPAAGAAAAEAPGRDRPAVTPARRRDPEGPPPAPWGSFPLIELTVLAGLILLVIGFFFLEGQRGTLFIVTGLALASIGGLEVAIREHFAGYRSHTLILAGVPAAVVLAALFILDPGGVPQAARLGIALAVFVAAAVVLVRVFRDRSGGHSFRLASFRQQRRD